MLFQWAHWSRGGATCSVSALVCCSRDSAAIAVVNWCCPSGRPSAVSEYHRGYNRWCQRPFSQQAPREVMCCVGPFVFAYRIDPSARGLHVSMLAFGGQRRQALTNHVDAMTSHVCHSRNLVCIRVLVACFGAVHVCALRTLPIRVVLIGWLVMAFRVQRGRQPIRDLPTTNHVVYTTSHDRSAVLE